MKKCFLILLLAFCLTKLYSNTNDSINNCITILNDKLGSSDISIKYGYRIVKNLWIKIGVAYNGIHELHDPQSSTVFKQIYDKNIFGLIIGIEKNKPTKMQNVDFVFGSNLRFNLLRHSYYYENPSIPEEYRTITNNNYNIGIGFNFGLYYNFNNNFSIGSEINPNVIYYFNDDKNPDTKITNFTYVLNNVSIISFRYRW